MKLIRDQMGKKGIVSSNLIPLEGAQNVKLTNLDRLDGMAIILVIKQLVDGAKNVSICYLIAKDIVLSLLRALASGLYIYKGITGSRDPKSRHAKKLRVIIGTIKNDDNEPGKTYDKLTIVF